MNGHDGASVSPGTARLCPLPGDTETPDAVVTSCAGQHGCRDRGFRPGHDTCVNRAGKAVVYLVVQRELSADFDRFVLDRSTALLRTAVLLVGDRGHAEDILQTALLRLATRWRSVHTAPEAYVRQVLVNLARDRWRRGRRRVREHELTNVEHVTDGRDPADTVADREALRKALAGLPRRQREVVVLRFFADLSVADTAQALRTSEGTVKAHTSRAVARLRQLLGNQITEDVHGV